MAATVAAALAGCAGAPMRPSDQHLVTGASAHMADVKRSADAIPATVDAPLMPPPPRNGPRLDTYSVVVSQVEISELLFAMARDARINVDVHPSITGKVTLNAIEQTLPQILNRLARQVDLRYEFDGANLVVMPDEPFVRHYQVDYVNMSRESVANTSIATQISSAGGNPLSTGGAGQANNNSTTQIVNRSSNKFWETLVANLRSIIEEAGAPEGGAGGGPAKSPGAGAASGSSGPSSGASASAGSSATSKPSASSGSSGPSSSSSTGTGRAGDGSSAPAAGSSTPGARDGDRAAPRLAAAVFANPEGGMITVRATSRQHEKVREYIDRTMNAARRQVLIEATIAEVQLSEEFQQGVNWQKLRIDGSGWAFTQQPNGSSPLGTGVAPGTGPGGIVFPTAGGGNLPGAASALGAAAPSLGVMRYLRTNDAGSVGFALSLLQSFGKVKVLSSPKISVLNNQTAVLKVVDNRVYFTIGVQITPGSTTSPAIVTYTSTPNTVPVGFVMSVTPQIEEHGMVTMNVRPTISRIVGFVNDPNPALAQANVVSRIPEIQTRELESLLKVGSGDIAVMGGLMQESVDDRTDAIPGAAQVPLVGELFKYRNDKATKSELVIFLRPIVIRDASLEGDYQSLKSLQPGSDFFSKPDRMPPPRAWTSSPEPAKAAPDPAPSQVPDAAPASATPVAR